jgi:hypothetical protein
MIQIVCALQEWDSGEYEAVSELSSRESHGAVEEQKRLLRKLFRRWKVEREDEWIELSERVRYRAMKVMSGKGFKLIEMRGV